MAKKTKAPLPSGPTAAPTMPTPPPAVLAVGVYLDTHNYNALVFAVRDGFAYYVANVEGNEFGVHATNVEDFARRYRNHLPGYPVRRCARHYANSLFGKSDQAAAVIRHLLHT